MKRILALVSLILTLPIGAWQSSPYFDTLFLARSEHVAEHLKNHASFQEGFFKTDDGIAINYLWLKRPYATSTVILASGFWPGKKEGIASFYYLFPDDCNLLFFDARGHGKSGGSLIASMLQYGKYECNDIIAAIRWAQWQQKCPIVLYGICAGAFHAARAVLTLQEQEKLAEYNISALIFDSGWSSVSDVAKTALSAEITAKLKPVKTKSSLFHSMITSLFHASAWCAHHAIVKPVLWWHKDDIALHTRIQNITIPLLFVHAERDTYAPITPVKKLACKAQNAHCWWISGHTKHACHQLTHKEQYKEKIANFFTEIVLQKLA